MLLNLTIRNVALIEYAELSFSERLNVLSGETGAGKSTIVNLVCRFFEPTSGSILIDGKDVR